MRVAEREARSARRGRAAKLAESERRRSWRSADEKMIRQQCSARPVTF